MAMISFAILFAFVSRASAAAMTTPTLTRVGEVAGVKPTSFTIGATATTQIPNSGTITITPAQPIFVVKTGITVTLTGGTGTCTDTTAAVAGSGNAIMTITIGAGCVIAPGAWTAAITDQDALAINPVVQVTSTMVSSADADSLAGTAYTAIAGLSAVTEVPECTNTGEKPTLVVSGTIAADATAALAAASTFAITSTVKIFEASQTFTSTQISMTGGANCAIAAATSSDAVPVLTVTLADAATSACAIAASADVVITISENYFVPTAAYTLSIAGAGTGVVGATARTPTTAITEVLTLVDNQEDGIKPTSIKYLFKNSGALAAAGTITITATESDASTALAVFANSQTDTTVTIKSGATTPAAVLCGVSAVTSATNVMTITLSDVATTCAIADTHVVEIDVSKADTIAVNPTGKTLAATITSSVSSTASCVAPGTFFTSGTKATGKSISDDGTSFIGGATTSASGALAAAGTIHFFATTGLFKDQATSTAVTLTGGTNCEANAVSAASAGALYPGHSSLTVTLSDKATATCAIAVSTAFTVTAAGSSFLGTRPTADTVMAGIMSTSSDVVAFEGATVLAITHKADPVITTSTNSSNSSNSTTTGLMMDDAPRLQGLKFFVAIFTLSFAAAL